MTRTVIIRAVLLLGASATQAIALILLARVDGPDNFGAFSAAFALMSAVAIVSSMGFSLRALRLGRGVDVASRIRTMAVLRYATVVAGVAGVGVSLLVLEGRLGAVVVFGLLLAGAEAVSDYTQNVLAGQSRALYAGAVLIAQRLMTLGAVVGAIAVGDMRLLWIGPVLVVIISLAVILRHMRGGRTQLRGVLRGGYGYWGSSAAAAIPQLEPYAAFAAGGATVGGLYSAASRIVSPINVALGAVLSVIVPRLVAARDSAERSREFLTLLRRVSYLSLGICLLSPVGAWLGTWVLGDSYSAGFPLMIGFLIAVGLSAVSQVLQAWSIGRGTPKDSVIALVAGGLVGVLSTIVLAPWGVFALAVGPVLAQLTILTVFWMKVRSDFSPTRVRGDN